jgi:hypothetical protein
MNPAFDAAGVPISWKTLIDPALVNPWMQWSDIVIGSPPEKFSTVRSEPEMGSVEREVAKTLSSLLRAHTSSTSITFLVWDGYGATNELVRTSDHHVVVPPNREMTVINTALDAIGTIPLTRQGLDTPLYWIPDDANWFAGADIYARSLLLGGNSSCIEDVLGHDCLEAYEVNPNDFVTPED